MDHLSRNLLDYFWYFVYMYTYIYIYIYIYDDSGSIFSKYTQTWVNCSGVIDTFFYDSSWLFWNPRIFRVEHFFVKLGGGFEILQVTQKTTCFWWWKFALFFSIFPSLLKTLSVRILISFDSSLKTENLSWTFDARTLAFGICKWRWRRGQGKDGCWQALGIDDSVGSEIRNHNR